MSGNLSLFLVVVLVSVFNFSCRQAMAADGMRAPLSAEELRAYAELSARIKDNYILPVDDKKLFSACLGGMVSGIDAESAYLDQETIRALQIGNTLALEVAVEKGQPVVVAPIEDGPAYDAGIKSGDVIVKVNEIYVQGMSLPELQRHLRIKPDEKIRLTLKRKGESQPISLSLTGTKFNSKSVKFRLIAPDIAYVRITQFREKTGEELAKAIGSLLEQNRKSLKGIILDLRDNPGGLLRSAVAVSAVFLNKDMLVVYTKGRTADSGMRLTTAPYDYDTHSRQTSTAINQLPASIKTVPLVVLVNYGSAAASEIVTGALQDYKRASIIGTPTFGKSSIQTILPLSGVTAGGATAAKLTTARWFTPSGRNVQPDGVVPDVIVDAPLDIPAQTVLNGDAQLKKALSLLDDSAR